MSGIFGGGAKAPPPPKPVRMPVASDPSILAAGQRLQESTKRRTGRYATILSDSLQNTMMGSAGKLGG